MNNYVRTPDAVHYDDIINNNLVLSSSLFVQLVMPNSNYKKLSEFLTRPLNRKDLGKEVGSLSYIKQSPKYFIRTKALQEHSFLPDFNSETCLPILPREFVNMHLKEGDVIISKDSNIGEAVILDRDYPNCMLSGAIYKLPIKAEWKYYTLAFIKHKIFREQLDAIVPKGATIRHAKTKFLDCLIPLPNTDLENIVQYVSLLTQAIINKEKLIKQRHADILKLIDDELRNNQKANVFRYNNPNINDLQKVGRLDASLYSVFYQENIFRIINYTNGYAPLTEQKLKLYPGPSLELKLLGTRIDSDKYINGFYRLITPKQITNYGTVKFEQYIGTPAKIKNIKYGDILFGESGTGRTLVYLDNDGNSINNAHAHVLRSELPNDLERIITIRSILQYYKETGLTDCLTVGGSGGHLSPSYFDRLFIPNFPKIKQKEIATLYYNPAEYNANDCTIESFLECDSEYNSKAGIYELDKTAKHLKELLDDAIDKIVKNQEVEVKF